MAEIGPRIWGHGRWGRPVESNGMGGPNRRRRTHSRGQTDVLSIPSPLLTTISPPRVGQSEWRFEWEQRRRVKGYSCPIVLLYVGNHCRTLDLGIGSYSCWLFAKSGSVGAEPRKKSRFSAQFVDVVCGVSLLRGVVAARRWKDDRRRE